MFVMVAMTSYCVVIEKDFYVDLLISIYDSSYSIFQYCGVKV